MIEKYFILFFFFGVFHILTLEKTG